MQNNTIEICKDSIGLQESSLRDIEVEQVLTEIGSGKDDKEADNSYEVIAFASLARFQLMDTWP